MRLRAVFALALGGLLGPVASPRSGAQGSCNHPRADSLTAAGWRQFRAGARRGADSLFASSLRACPGDPGAVVGQGYVALQDGRTPDARRAFALALQTLPNNVDALTGLGLAAWRLNELDAARDAFTRVLRVSPNDSTAKAYLARIPVQTDARKLPGRARPDSLVLVSRTGPRRFEVRRNGGWQPMWIKAVNIGAALPGRFPSEFPPDDGTYETWIALTARMGANAVRVYTIHPPHFYRALSRWNAAHPDSALWLIHGVWTESPPGKLEEHYDNAAWNLEFRSEMRRVVDLLHGNAAIQPRPGHASGLYDTDVSRWVLAYIVGREWEPYSVVTFAKANPLRTSFTGTYIAVKDVNAVDVWLAQFCNGMIAYEMDRYHAQRPIAYTNWPTLDPLRHPTETTKDEETALLKARGEHTPEPSHEYDNDAIALDATKWHATTAFPAGVFASFHAYPYYPDFIGLDATYAKAKSPFGSSNYFGYLTNLVAYHGTMPVVISEYGVPSSRGNAHREPQGWDHGGHDEAAQARIDARLTREIHASGAAGAGLFAIIDEWFKKNWLVIDFEQPGERNRLWLNPLDAEQNYGVIAMRAGVRDSAIVIDGNPSDWKTRTPLLTATPVADRPAPERVRALYVAYDEAYVYLRVTVDSIDWTRAHYLIGVDTYDRKLGDKRLPYTGATSPVGLEFVVDLKGPDDARVLVDSPYSPYRLAAITGANPAAVQMVLNAPFKTRGNSRGRYDTLRVVPNRRRLGRDGWVFPEQIVERNKLRFARQQETTLADWYAANGTIELRIPWGMLQVMDPSSRTVLFGANKDKLPGPGVATDGFHFVVMSYDPANPEKSGVKMPADARGAFTDPPLWSWPKWEIPRWFSEVKPAFAAMRDAFSSIR